MSTPRLNFFIGWGTADNLDLRKVYPVTVSCPHDRIKRLSERAAGTTEAFRGAMVKAF